MALLRGYSYETVQRNYSTLRAEGVSQQNAVAAAYALGRVSFFQKYPQGAIPTWLSHPRGYRLREHYNNRGECVVKSPQYAENPAGRAQHPNPRKMQQAAALFEDFTGKRASRITKHSLPESPREGLVFGTLVQVGYESARDGKLYRHTFRKRSRPLLVATPDGKTVLIVGGRYAFTDRGIEDR